MYTVLYAEIEGEEALKVYADHEAHVHFKTLTGYKTGTFRRRHPFLCILIELGREKLISQVYRRLRSQTSWLSTSRCRRNSIA